MCKVSQNFHLISFTGLTLHMETNDKHGKLRTTSALRPLGVLLLIYSQGLSHEFLSDFSFFFAIEIATWSGENSFEGWITASFQWARSRTQSDIQKTWEETAYIEITCAVKGYQECCCSVVGEELSILKKISFKGRAC